MWRILGTYLVRFIMQLLSHEDVDHFVHTGHAFVLQSFVTIRDVCVP